MHVLEGDGKRCPYLKVYANIEGDSVVRDGDRDVDTGEGVDMVDKRCDGGNSGAEMGGKRVDGGDAKEVASRDA